MDGVADWRSGIRGPIFLISLLRETDIQIGPQIGKQTSQSLGS